MKGSCDGPKIKGVISLVLSCLSKNITTQLICMTLVNGSSLKNSLKQLVDRKTVGFMSRSLQKQTELFYSKNKDYINPPSSEKNEEIIPAVDYSMNQLTHVSLLYRAEL